jgi:4-hydroxybenzoate polyprenyltransferase
LAILLQLNGLAQVLGVASLLLVALYPLAKRVTWWPQLMMGFTFGFGAPLGYAAGAGHLSIAWAVLYGAAILWDLGFDTIYAHQDREDDALIGIKSTALLFGERTKPMLALFFAAAVLLIGVAGYLVGAGLIFWLALAAFAGHLAWQIQRLDITDPDLCLVLFKSNRDAGLILFAGLLLAAAAA